MIIIFLLENSRKKYGRDASPTLCFIDSASRRSGLSDSSRGIDRFKKIKGIKRHLVVDSQGNILHAHTTCANINDGKACLEMIAETKCMFPFLKEMRGDMGYRGEERSISWLDNCRRLVRNYERECASATYMTVTAEVYRLLRFI